MVTGYVQVVTTIDSEEAALELARPIVESRYGSAVQMYPLRSVYWWGSVQDESEWQLVVKTTDDLVSTVIARIRERHSYEVPEIIVTPIIDGLQEYLDWISTETSGAAR